MHVRALRQLCAPVEAAPLAAAADAAWLACYALSPRAGEPAFVPPGAIRVTSAPADQTVIVRNAERRLCVPTEVVPE
ncbi:MAG: hypothetical protein AB1689_02295 [Thermodesulfobacteriota bacterium]